MNWISSPDFKADSQFLWHCWWLPHRFVSLDYGKGLAVLLGWDAAHLKMRYEFWHNHAIAEVSHDGGLEANGDVFELFQGLNTDWETDRNEALNRLFPLLRSNIERHQHCSPTWIYRIIWHWQQLHDSGRASCAPEAQALLELAQKHLPLREVA